MSQSSSRNASTSLGTRFAVVVHTGAEQAALRVSRGVRDLLRIDIHAVDDDGHVEMLAD
jgi:hypothetical protein